MIITIEVIENHPSIVITGGDTNIIHIVDAEALTVLASFTLENITKDF